MAKKKVNALDWISNTWIVLFSEFIHWMWSNAQVGDLIELYAYYLVLSTNEEQDNNDISDNGKILQEIKKMLTSSWMSEETISNLEDVYRNYSSMAYMSDVLEYWKNRADIDQTDISDEALEKLIYEYEDNIDVQKFCKLIVKWISTVEAPIDVVFTEYISNEKLLKLDEDIVNKDLVIEERLEKCKNRIKITEDLIDSLFNDTSKERYELIWRIEQLKKVIPRLVNEEAKVTYWEFYELVSRYYVLLFNRTMAAKKRMRFDLYIPENQIKDLWDLEKKYENVAELSLLTESATIIESTAQEIEWIKTKLEKIQIKIFWDKIKMEWKLNNLYNILETKIESWRIEFEVQKDKDIGEITDYINPSEYNSEILGLFIKLIHSATPEGMISWMLIAKVMSTAITKKEEANEWKDIFIGISKYLTAYTSVVHIENALKKIEEHNKSLLAEWYFNELDLLASSKSLIFKIRNDIKERFDKRKIFKSDFEDFIKDFDSYEEDERMNKLDLIYENNKNISISTEQELTLISSIMTLKEKVWSNGTILRINDVLLSLFFDLVKQKNIYNKMLAFDKNIYFRIKFNQLSREDILLYWQFTAETERDYDETELSIVNDTTQVEEVDIWNLADNNQEKNIWNSKLVSIPIVIIGFFIGKYLWIIWLLGTFWSMYLWYLLWWWIKENNHINKAIVKVLAWSNLFTWIIPFIWYFTSVVSFVVYKNYWSKKLFYISIISFIATVINSIVWIMNNL